MSDLNDLPRQRLESSLLEYLGDELLKRESGRTEIEHRPAQTVADRNVALGLGQKIERMTVDFMSRHAVAELMPDMLHHSFAHGIRCAGADERRFELGRIERFSLARRFDDGNGLHEIIIQENLSI